MVERYLPGVTSAELATALRRTESEVQAMSGRGTELRYLRSTFVPSEEAVFCLFQAPSADEVMEVNRRSGFQVDRITEVLSLRREA
jgi:hypothetical protein